jgi:hypothetical protein
VQCFLAAGDRGIEVQHLHRSAADQAHRGPYHFDRMLRNAATERDLALVIAVVDDRVLLQGIEQRPKTQPASPVAVAHRRVLPLRCDHNRDTSCRGMGVAALLGEQRESVRERP